MTYDPFNELIAETDPAVLAEGHRWVQQQFYGATMYTDFYLRFDTPADADAVLYEGEGDDRRAKYAAIDVLGTIWKPTGNALMTEEGEVFEHAPIDGWHVNVRHNAEAPELEAYRVFPATPQRMWF